MIDENELLFDKIYERTKDFDRIHFIKEIMRLQRENQQLKERLKQLDNGFMACVEEKCEIAEENEKYKSVLDEIGRYLTNNRNTCYMDDDIDILLQIIYKGRE